jgi:hypothetical protein
MFDLAWRTIASDPRVIALPEPPALILVREAYYLEVEADGAALQWLMQSRRRHRSDVCSLVPVCLWQTLSMPTALSRSECCWPECGW